MLQLEAAARIHSTALAESLCFTGRFSPSVFSFLCLVSHFSWWLGKSLPAELLTGGFTLLTYHSWAVRCVNCTLQLCQMNLQWILVPSYYYLWEYYFPWTAEVSEGRELELISPNRWISRQMVIAPTSDRGAVVGDRMGPLQTSWRSSLWSCAGDFFQLWSGISTSVSWIKGIKNLRGRREGRDCFIPWLLTFWFLAESQCRLYFWQQER